MVFRPLKTLFRRKNTTNNICEACGMHVETIMHMLCFCSRGIEGWSSSKLTLPFIIQDSCSFVGTFNRLQNRWEAQPGLLEKWVTICWGIWKSRNEVRHGGKRRTGLAIMRSSLKLLEDFQIANEKSSQVSLNHWHKTGCKSPLLGYFKVNMDGALFSKSKQSGIGAIVRDREGNVITTLDRKLDLPLGALEVVAKALETGVQFAKDVGLRNVAFEGDSLLIINAVHGVGEAASSV